MARSDPWSLLKRQPMAESATAAAEPPRRASPTASHAVPHHRPGPEGRKELAMLSLGGLGVVYGDIGTSPLHAIGECMSSAKDESGHWVKEHAIHPGADGMYDPAAVLGI